MSQEPDYRRHLSLMLSQVLDDIGVNDKMVTKRREFCMLGETLINLTNRLSDGDITYHYVGSQSEGTTTGGLGSDVDVLIYRHEWNIIQDPSEWEHGKINYLMIQDEDTTDGYCFLQLFHHSERSPVTDISDARHRSDGSGRILLKNTIFNDFIQGAETHGPSNALKGGPRGSDKDLVQAFPCKSWPQSASGWLKRQGIGGWPTKDMRKHAVDTYRCSVVATGSKVSKRPELEWRISTSLAERYLMLNLNITQIRCYVLLKMILKSFLNPQAENISSFMCKTVLLSYIEKSEQSIWKNDNLFTCLTDCLSELHTCVQNGSCLHFIIEKNDLMAGQFTAENKHDLSKSITELIQSDGKGLLRINIDDLGQRLQVKLNMVQHGYRLPTFPTSLEIHNYLKTIAYINIAGETSDCHKRLLSLLHNKMIMTMEKSVSNLHDIMTSKDNVNRSDHAAITFLAPFIFTTYGSILASSSIGENNQVSPKALAWLKRGSNSDISSSRLKSASVLYSTGALKQAEKILREIEHQYDSNPATPICACWVNHDYAYTPKLLRVCGEQSEDVIKNITAFCVRFIQIEINCVPHELQYEMFRSTQYDMMKHRHQHADFWMDWAVVDSLPFLYFLQYKIFRHLQKHQDQQRALSKLIKTIVKIKNLNHRETALNIYGQCMEQENRPQKALNCYLLSLQLRAKNNVANYHICKLLSRILAGQ